MDSSEKILAEITVFYLVPERTVNHPAEKHVNLVVDRALSRVAKKWRNRFQQLAGLHDGPEKRDQADCKFSAVLVA